MANITEAKGTMTLKGPWTQETLDAFKPVLATWHFSGQYGIDWCGSFSLGHLSAEFSGYGRWGFSETLKSFDSWTREWLKDHPRSNQDVDFSFDQSDVIISGMTFVLTGTFLGYEDDRNGIKPLIASKGGRCTGSISGKTDYLVIGHYGDFGDKKLDDICAQRAKGHYVKIIRQIDLFDALQVPVKSCTGEIINEHPRKINSADELQIPTRYLTEEKYDKFLKLMYNNHLSIHLSFIDVDEEGYRARWAGTFISDGKRLSYSPDIKRTF